PSRAMSVPARIGAYTSATEAERVKRGSTTISRALLCALASVTHLKPHGCASAALPPIDRKSTRLNSSHTEIYTLSLHDALPICVKRGSTTISRALLCALASVTHLKPHGCASAALPP